MVTGKDIVLIGLQSFCRVWTNEVPTKAIRDAIDLIEKQSEELRLCKELVDKKEKEIEKSNSDWIIITKQQDAAIEKRNIIISELRNKLMKQDGELVKLRKKLNG